MSTPIILILALLLDAALGEPKWLWDRLPHPAVLMGRAVSALDRMLNPKRGGIMAGALTMALLIGGAYLIGWALSLLGPVVEIIVCAILLAQHSLVQHVAAVADGLRVSLGDGRRAVAMIVSRDTAGMDQSAVARSAIESAAENLSDGIIAPAFWFLIGGLPALLVYKIINTADSMIAYRTPRYEYFGKAAAYVDDIMNLIPSRVTCWLIAIPAGLIGQWREIGRDARKHRSPNAGWPEAAMSRAIGVALAGPRTYNGKMQEFPWVGDSGNQNPDPSDIDAAIGQLWRAWGMLLGLTVLLALFGYT
ncbi:adenosylcobinamide-phosphate synthase CbiB [uncultured Sulfitobacter sp.]|uniref:adenosylcobinamide-phosphate synthase CbiB n=1 Tax=uncultured Sulfitobacter sp. TaxID=191468 RepID=UPI002625FCFB|nr:adenosylcobinamide-phosphate synthase CbiB [uncultured Sulfitobacter sp.]